MADPCATQGGDCELPVVIDNATGVTHLDGRDTLECMRALEGIRDGNNNPISGFLMCQPDGIGWLINFVDEPCLSLPEIIKTEDGKFSHIFALEAGSNCWKQLRGPDVIPDGGLALIPMWEIDGGIGTWVMRQHDHYNACLREEQIPDLAKGDDDCLVYQIIGIKSCVGQQADTVCFRKTIQSPIILRYSGQKAIGNGDTDINVLFGAETPSGDPPIAVLISFSKGAAGDTNLVGNLYSITKDGFSVKLTAAAGNANYILHWFAIVE